MFLYYDHSFIDKTFQYYNLKNRNILIIPNTYIDLI